MSQARALCDTCAPGLSAITTQLGELMGGLASAGQRACSRVRAGHDLDTLSPDPGPFQSPDPGHTRSPDPGPFQSPDPGHTLAPDPGHMLSPDPGHSLSPDPGHMTKLVPNLFLRDEKAQTVTTVFGCSKKPVMVEKVGRPGARFGGRRMQAKGPVSVQCRWGTEGVWSQAEPWQGWWGCWMCWPRDGGPCPGDWG